ncbi:transposase [Burkholderia contaminans]|nr:transposase [Burkholderia contaminans]
MRENHTQHPQKLNVWAGIVGEQIIGPYFIEGNLTAATYLNLLQDHIVPAIAHLFPDNNRPGLPNGNVFFQQDGAPPHYGMNVRRYLDQVFPGRWIGRRGFIEWPARSPDLNPLNFFLWCHLKTQVYKEKPANLQVLEAKIRQEIRAIPPEWLHNVIRNFTDRLGHCQVAEGGHFEHLI